MLKHNKIVLGLLLCTFTFLGLFQEVYAEDKNKDKKEEDLEFSDMCIKWKKENISLLQDAYGLSIKYIPENPANCLGSTCSSHPKSFHISMETDRIVKDRTKAKFYISKIELIEMAENLRDESVLKAYEEKELEDTFHIGSSNLISKDLSLYVPNIANDTIRYRFTLVPADGFSDSIFVKNCGKNATMEIYIDYDYYGEPIYSSDPTAESIDPSKYKFKDEELINSGKIDCNRIWDEKANPFEHAFCQDMANFNNSGAKKLEFTTELDTYAKLALNNKLPETIQYKCDAFAPLNIANDSKDYYSNKSYLYGSINYKIKGEYVYNYGGPKVEKGKKVTGMNGEFIGSMIKSEEASCTVQCDEVVTTEYGPPVASKAGLCFEYKVKVTSRVNCHVVKYPDKPKINQGYCTPAPGCNHGNGYVDIAAGPNEEYEACVDKCDGGKYTDKCSKKCYKEVYGNTKASKTSLNLDYPNKYLPSLVSNTQGQNLENVCHIHVATEAEKKKGIVDYYDYGFYYHTDEKYPRIVWDPSTKLGRWYCMNAKSYIGLHACVKNDQEGGGISSVCGCGARCIWYGCSDETYLNANESLQDDMDNILRYNELIDKCASYSKCSTTQAEFSINVDYSYGDKNSTTRIYFPYTPNNDINSKDTIVYNRNDKTVTCTDQNANSTILSTNGCYTCTGKNEKSTNDSTKSSNHWYQTEWSFPGTWIHNKTGEISYTPTNKPGWVSYKEKFCIPLDANDVNQKWWNAYYISRYGHDKVVSYFSTSSLSDKCSITSCDGGAFTPSDVDNLKYNINAHTRKFGLLQWDIDISCFYALNSEFPKHEHGSSCTFNDPKCLTNPRDIKVRSVELTNLFPATDGTINTSAAQTGRTPGFNWSIYATNILKDQAYTSRPANYVKWVQKKGYNVYSDEYLDYEFNLTKEDIRRLKNEGENYTAYKGESVMNSVINYQSSLFRGDNAILHSSKIPQLNALKCNNLKNYRSDECDDFAEDGE